MSDLNLLSNYDYELPESLIAQNPANPRDSSRLMVLDASKKTLEHRIFRDIIEYLLPGDLLILNDTRVLPARVQSSFAGKNAEVLFIRPTSDENVWEALVKPGKYLKAGAKLPVPDGEIEIVGELDGVRLVKISCSVGAFDWLERHGETPLPPYIKNSSAQMESYQTVFARVRGSAAAPTASLHFTNSLIEEISHRIKISYVTLHVGLGTFRPVRSDDIRQHIMHRELCTIPAETAKIISECKKSGGRVIAGGTTVVRTLESFEVGESGIKDTEIFITPGFKFKTVDAMITNFHTPKSSLLMLVSAFIGDHEFLMRAYKKAILNEYRFFSFGDAMFISKL